MSVAEIPGESRVLLSHVSWSTFEALLAETDNRGTRFTYDRGYLEIMSPSREHEKAKTLIARMIEELTLELDIPISSAGSTTLKDQLHERGVEPDECYYIANELRVRGRDDLDLTNDPPPDLAIEVGITRSGLDKFAIYASLGVPELWSYEGEQLRVYQLQADGTYARQDRSRSLPRLPLEEVSNFLRRRNDTDETSLIKSFRSWVRKTLAG